MHDGEVCAPFRFRRVALVGFMKPLSLRETAGLCALCVGGSGWFHSGKHFTTTCVWDNSNKTAVPLRNSTRFTTKTLSHALHRGQTAEWPWQCATSNAARSTTTTATAAAMGVVGFTLPARQHAPPTFPASPGR